MKILHRPSASNVADGELHTAHRHIVQLMVEVGHLPPTPGVLDDLIGQLRHEIDAHLDVVERILLPACTGPIDEDLVERARSSHRKLRARAHALAYPMHASEAPHLSGALDELRRAFIEHVELEEEELLPQLRIAIGTARMNKLGFDIGDLAESYAYRRGPIGDRSAAAVIDLTGPGH